MPCTELMKVLSNDLVAGKCAKEVYIGFTTHDVPWSYFTPSMCNLMVQPLSTHVQQPQPAWRMADLLNHSLFGPGVLIDALASRKAYMYYDQLARSGKYNLDAQAATRGITVQDAVTLCEQQLNAAGHLTTNLPVSLSFPGEMPASSPLRPCSLAGQVKLTDGKPASPSPPRSPPPRSPTPSAQSHQIAARRSGFSPSTKPFSQHRTGLSPLASPFIPQYKRGFSGAAQHKVQLAELNGSYSTPYSPRIGAMPMQPHVQGCCSCWNARPAGLSHAV